jgi:DNA mismatch endonuclease (patch repair protein)
MPLTRSEQMSRIRRKGTQPERLLADALTAAGISAEEHIDTSAGRADLGYPARRIAVYVDGCYFHGCPEHYVRPRNPADFWARKLASNVDRDVRQTRMNTEAGWRVLRFWECEVRADVAAIVQQVRRAIDGEPVEHQLDWRVRVVEVLDPETDLERRHVVSLWDHDVRGDTVRTRTTHKHGRKKGT